MNGKFRLVANILTLFYIASERQRLVPVFVRESF